MQTQLEGVYQALEIANVEHHSVRTQLEGICQGIEYLTGMAWKMYMGNHGSLASRRGEGSSKGVTRQETWVVGVETGEGLSEVRGGDPEDTKVISKLKPTDKGKGKGKEVRDEENLQELEQQNV